MGIEELCRLVDWLVFRSVRRGVEIQLRWLLNDGDGGAVEHSVCGVLGSVRVLRGVRYVTDSSGHAPAVANVEYPTVVLQPRKISLDLLGQV